MSTTTLAASAAAVRPPSMTSASRINPDTRLVLAGLLLVLVAVAAASFTLSFTGVSAAAPWAAIPARLAWLVPVALEVAMLAYVVTAAVRTHRGQRARLAWTLVWALTTVSSAINALHAWDAGPQGWQGIVGAGIAAMFPFMTLAAAHVVVGVAFAPRPDTISTPDADTGRTPASADETDSADAGGMSAGIFSPRMSHLAADTGRDTATDTDARPNLATAATTPQQTDTRTDTGHPTSGRTPRAAQRGRVSEHRETVVRLARTTSMSGRRIAEDLGLDKTAVCKIVREERTRDDEVTRVNFGQGTLVPLTDAVGSPA